MSAGDTHYHIWRSGGWLMERLWWTSYRRHSGGSKLLRFYSSWGWKLWGQKTTSSYLCCSISFIPKTLHQDFIRFQHQLLNISFARRASVAAISSNSTDTTRSCHESRGNKANFSALLDIFCMSNVQLWEHAEQSKKKRRRGRRGYIILMLLFKEQLRNRVVAAIAERECQELLITCIEASFNFNLLCCSRSCYLEWLWFIF